jgi:transporter family protein
MIAWFWYALVAAILYGAHQIFTKLASDHISDGLGGFVVEATAALRLA